MHTVTMEEFQDAVEYMNLISLTSSKQLKAKYLELSKLYHPDAQAGDQEQFQHLQQSYEIIKNYINNFRYVLDQEEFKRQNPILVSNISKEQIK